MIEYLNLDDYLYIAEEILGVEPNVLSMGTSIGLADSALQAPQASFGGHEFYPSLATKAAILCWHLARNHPLPDGNKRSAWVTMRVFLRRNGFGLRYQVADAETLMNDVATGSVTEEALAAWIEERMYDL